jgi:hypothetical protein
MAYLKMRFLRDLFVGNVAITKLFLTQQLPCCISLHSFPVRTCFKLALRRFVPIRYPVDPDLAPEWKLLLN